MRVDNISRTVEAMIEILKMATTQSTDIAEKLIKMNTQSAVGVYQDEQLGNNVDILG